MSSFLYKKHDILVVGISSAEEYIKICEETKSMSILLIIFTTLLSANLNSDFKLNSFLF